MSASNELLGVGSRVNHPAYGDGVIIRLHPAAYDVTFIVYGTKTVGKEYSDWEILDHVEAEEAVTWTEAERSLMRILKTWGEISELVAIGDKWKGGTMSLQPYDQSLKPKEIPIETFYHKVVMLRDRLRVMEQKINSNKKLSDEDKIDLQQYITRIYGSLTTFNVLFRDKGDHFVGDKA
jgi:hypothetical protein